MRLPDGQQRNVRPDVIATKLALTEKASCFDSSLPGDGMRCRLWGLTDHVHYLPVGLAHRLDEPLIGHIGDAYQSHMAIFTIE